MSLTEAVKEWFLKEVLQNQQKELHKMSQLSDAIQAVADKLTSAESNLATLATDIQKTLADLAAKIAAGTVQQADIDAVNALSSRAGTIADTLAAQDTVVKNADQ